MRRRLLQLGALVVSWSAAVLAAFGLIEIYTRVVADTGMNFDLEMWKYAVHMRQASPALGHAQRPGASGHLMGVDIKINGLGQRDREFALDKPSNAVRIMMLGDSITFGWGVPAHLTPSKILERRLNQAVHNGPAVEVINAGVVDYNTFLEVDHFLRIGAGMKPDVVVLNYFINDAEPTPSPVYPWWARHSQALIFVGQRILVLRRAFGRGDWKDHYAKLYAPNAPGWTVAQDSIRRLADYCRRNGIKMVLANYPELHELKEYPFGDVNRKIEAAAAAAGMPYLDLYPAVAGLDGATLWVSPTDAHPNPVATEKFADVLADYLAPLVRELGQKTPAAAAN